MDVLFILSSLMHMIWYGGVCIRMEEVSRLSCERGSTDVVHLQWTLGEPYWQILA